MSTVRLLVLWALMAVAMSANGVFRELVLKARVSASHADVVSAALGCAIILALTAAFLRPLAAQPIDELVRVSLTLVSLTVVFEFLIGRWVDHKSWQELFANYAFWNGRLWPLVLLVLALTPFVWGRWLNFGRVTS